MTLPIEVSIGVSDLEVLDSGSRTSEGFAMLVASRARCVRQVRLVAFEGPVVVSFRGTSSGLKRPVLLANLVTPLLPSSGKLRRIYWYE